MDGEQLVSVIIPVYNDECYLGEALESVFAQTYRPLEIIVVDDGSTDDSARIAASFGEHVRYSYQANAGSSAARNRGLALARGEYIGFLDADDLWTPDKLELQTHWFREEPMAEVVFGAIRLLQLRPTPTGEIHFEQSAEPEWFWNLSVALSRRTVFAKVGGFDETLRAFEHGDWFTRARELGVAIRFHPSVVYLYRLHEKHQKSHFDKQQPYQLRMFKQSLDRRRQQKGVAPPLPKLDRLPDLIDQHPDARRGPDHER